MKQIPLGDLSVSQFLSEYWQKKPVVIRNAIANFEPIIEADELAGLACEEEVESRLIINSADQDPTKVSLKHGPLAESDFNELPASHWTLLVQAVDHYHPQASELLSLFDFIPQWRTDDLMISYSTTGGGVGPHYDNYDVFLLQASGQKEWQYGGLFDENSSRQESAELLLLADWQAEHTVTLNPGDILYIPPKVGHSGIALSDDCTTYSVGFRAPSHAEILTHFSDFVSHDLSSGLRYTDPDLQPQEHSAQITKQSIEHVKTVLQQYIDQPGLIEQWFGCYMSEHKYAEQQQSFHLENSVEEIIEAIQQGDTLYKIPGTRLAFQYDEQTPGNTMMFFINGMCCQIAQEQQSFVLALCQSDEVVISDIASSPERLKLMANLIKISAYEIQ
ncbi:cupin domain-containing protein [Gammaproteobacteria bacterium AS21]